MESISDATEMAARSFLHEGMLQSLAVGLCGELYSAALALLHHTIWRDGDFDKNMGIRAKTGRGGTGEVSWKVGLWFKKT